MELTSELMTPPSASSLAMAPPDDLAINEWLSLTDYSAKYRISVSTLRRRIKTDQIAHRFIDGKYMLLDSRPIELDHSYQQQESLGVSFAVDDGDANIAPEPPPTEEQLQRFETAPFLDELKHAYTRILQEKEESIIQLKGEISDLHTLVNVLEGDNMRMRRTLGIEMP